MLFMYGLGEVLPEPNLEPAEVVSKEEETSQIIKIVSMLDAILVGLD